MAQLMEKYDLSFVAFSPLEEGILLDKFKAENPPQFKPGDNRATKEIFRAESLTKLRPKMDKLKARFGSTTEDLAATAINYVLALPRVACVIPGPRSEVQARCNLSGIGRKMSPEDVQFIRDLFAE
jgi:aryl-alcohol dehydrogenase-like predicted oxidoreductase